MEVPEEQAAEGFAEGTSWTGGFQAQSPQRTPIGHAEGRSMEREDWKNSFPAPPHIPRKKTRMPQVALPKTLGVCMPPSPCSPPAHPGRGSLQEAAWSIMGEPSHLSPLSHLVVTRATGGMVGGRWRG